MTHYIDTRDDLNTPAMVDREYREAWIPVIEKIARFRSMRGDELDQLRLDQAATSGRRRIALAVARTLCNAAGELLFDPQNRDHLDRISSYHSRALDAMTDVIDNLCGNQTPIEHLIAAAKKNYSETTSGDSPTKSPAEQTELSANTCTV